MPRFLGEFEHLLLLSLVHLADDAHTGRVRTTVEGWAGRSVSPGAVFTGLERLERRGLVESWFGDPTPERGGKRKKFFRLTPAGAATVKEAQETFQRVSRALAPRLRSL